MKIKSLFVGRPLKEVKAYASKWETFKWHVANVARKTFHVVLITMVVFAIAEMYRRTQPPVYADREVMVDNLGMKINQLKGEMLASLKNCESAGHKESDGIIIFDSNNRASIGSYQFQKKTVQHYMKTLYNVEITPKEAVLIALDDEKAGNLASDIIFKTDKGLTNWINCSNKLGLVTQLKMIKKLEN